jgi:endogenous inhibitor of DNA gyrase (YacG/DUF329 family)
MNDKNPGPREAPCPHCGTDAEWSFLDDANTQVEVVCPDCGRFEMPRADFDEAAADIAELNEPQ